MSTIYNDLKNSGQAFLYVFIDPAANLNATIMQKRVEQLARLKEMYLADKTYTPDQMIGIIRESIYQKYNKSPELILQIIFDNAVRIAKTGIGAALSAGDLTFDPESNQYYDGSGNAFILDAKQNVVSKNGQSVDLKIDSPATLTNISVTNPASPVKSTFWKDVQSVIEWIVGLFTKLGINTGTKISTYSPGSTDWAKLNTGSGLSSAGIGDYVPYIFAAGIIYYLVTGAGKSKKTKTN